MEITIIIADDHKILRDGLRNILEQYPDIKVIGEATDGYEAVALAKKLNPDVIIMDVTMKTMNGIEATRQLSVQSAASKVIALSMHDNKRFIIGMFKAGAYGYLLKDCDTNELIRAIHVVNSGKRYVAQRLSNVLMDDLINIGKETTELSLREEEILRLIAKGKSSKEIADMLFLSSKTVDAHRKNIMDKLEIRNLPDLTKYALKQGLISLDE